MAATLAPMSSSTGGATAIALAGQDTLRQRGISVKTTTVVHDSSSSSDGDDASDSDVSTFTPPSFTIKDLLGAIPKHCFERSAFRSSLYVVADFAMLATFAYLASHIDSNFNFKDGAILQGYPGTLARIVSWAVYCFCAGSVGTGVWILAHECGHQAFSTSKTLNNAVGLVLHSFLLVPYHSWRISHARHHAATGSMERDEVFIPKTRSQLGLPPAHETRDLKLQPSSPSAAIVDAITNKENTFEQLDELLEDAPLWNLFWVFTQQTFGWPAYLLRNASGQKFGRWTNHFDPNSPIFDKRHFWQIIISDIGILTTLTVLTLWAQHRSLAEVARYYIIPYLIVNHHLVMITYLQHSDPLLPHYRKEEWNFQRGALCTIDRNLYGPIGAFIMHGICETHVAHHICSKIPHYHAWEATEALKGLLGEYYMSSDDNMYGSLVYNYATCKFVEDQGSCVFYKDRFGKAARRVVYEEDSGVDVQDSVGGQVSGTEDI